MPGDSGSSPNTGSISNYCLTQEIFTPTPADWTIAKYKEWLSGAFPQSPWFILFSSGYINIEQIVTQTHLIEYIGPTRLVLSMTLFMDYSLLVLLTETHLNRGFGYIRSENLRQYSCPFTLYQGWISNMADYDRGSPLYKS